MLKNTHTPTTYHADLQGHKDLVKALDPRWQRNGPGFMNSLMYNPDLSTHSASLIIENIFSDDLNINREGLIGILTDDPQFAVITNSNKFIIVPWLVEFLLTFPSDVKAVAEEPELKYILQTFLDKYKNTFVAKISSNPNRYIEDKSLVKRFREKFNL